MGQIIEKQRYKEIRYRLSEEHGDNLSKWMKEHDAICKMKDIIDVAYVVTKDKIKELTWRNEMNAVDNDKLINITELLNKNNDC